MTRTARIAVACLMIPAFATSAFAQDEDFGSEEREVKYKERTEIDFDGVDVTGELVKPQGTLAVERSRAVFNPLIKLRDSFAVEMKQSVDEVK